MLSPFVLPSNREIEITFRKALVSECMEFSEISPDHEESLTTEFLNAVQVPDKFVDSRAWTADDRRFGLYWYWVQTTHQHVQQFSYDCKHCGKQHTHTVDWRDLITEVVELKGKAEREIEIDLGNGPEMLVVRPHSGFAMEEIEKVRLLREAARHEEGEDSARVRSLSAQIRFKEVLLAFQFKNDTEKDDEKRKRAREQRMLSLDIESYRVLVGAVLAGLHELEHGLPTAIVDGEVLVLLPPHYCPVSVQKNNGVKEGAVSTTLHTRFRPDSAVPTL